MHILWFLLALFFGGGHAQGTPPATHHPAPIHANDSLGGMPGG